MSEQHHIHVSYRQLDYTDLDKKLQELVDKARLATNQAYAPYSNFYVGAAVLLDDNSIHIGANQENAAFPSGLCAERVLLNYVHANFPEKKPVALAIAAKSKTDFTVEPVVPCGACLQVMSELEQSWQVQLPVYLVGEKRIIEVEGIRNFLPFAFNGSFLK